MNEVEHERAEQPLPLEQLYTDRYQAIMQKFKEVLDRLKQAGDSNASRREYTHAEFSRLCPSSIALVFQACDIISYVGDQVHLHGGKQVAGELGQALLVQYLRAEGGVALTSEQYDAYSDMLDNAEEQGYALVGSDAVAPERRRFLKLADRTGIFLPSQDDERRSVLNPHAKHLTNNSREAALWLTSVVQRSRDIPGITKGWNRLAVSRRVADSTFDDGLYRRLRKSRHLETSLLIDQDGIDETLWVNVAPSAVDSELPRIVVERQPNKNAEQAANWEKTLKALLLATREALTLRGVTLPEGIFVVTRAVLEKTFQRKGVTDLKGPTRLGLLAPAYVSDPETDNPNLKMYDQYKALKAFFVTLRRSDMNAWLSSPEYQAWIDADQLTEQWGRAWTELIQREAIGQVDYMPKKTGEVYLVPQQGLDRMREQLPMPVNQNDHLMVAAAGPRDQETLYLYFSNSVDGRSYRRYLRSTYSEDDSKQMEGRTAELVKWRMQQITQLEAWGRFKPLPAEAGLSDDIRLVGLADLRTALSQLAPLSTKSLHTRGYIAEAQYTPARDNRGYLIVCPEGPTQLSKVKASAWYQAQMKPKR